MFKKMITVLSVAVFTLMMSTSALALKPIVVFEYEGPDDIQVVECGDYDVRTSSWAKIIATDYFDEDGNFIREHVRFHISDAIYYNSAVPDIYISNQGAGNGENVSQWYYADGTIMEAGMPFRIMLPGIGKLYMMAGHGYWDGENFSWTGLQVFPDDGTGSKLCKVLAP